MSSSHGSSSSSHAGPSSSHAGPSKPHKPPFNLDRLSGTAGQQVWPPPSLPQAGGHAHIASHPYVGHYGETPDNSQSHDSLHPETLKSTTKEQRKKLIVARANYLTQCAYGARLDLSLNLSACIDNAKAEKRCSLQKPDKVLEMPLPYVSITHWVLPLM